MPFYAMPGYLARRPGTARWVALVLIAAAPATGVDASSSGLGRLGAADCVPPSPMTGDVVQGTPASDDVELWGWLMPTGPLPLRAGQDVKIVWRMTGTGDLRLTAWGPDGKARPLQWGPEKHSGSNFTKPGDEWGAGYHLAKPGCWRLHAARANGSADVWIRVAA
jgi:hypothetical protein